MPDLSSASTSTTEFLSSTVPPTSYLPPIKSLSLSTETRILHQCIAYLRQIYVPSVRGSRRKKTKPPSNLTELHSPSSSSPLATIRKDSFERAYALRWLSALTRLESDSADSPDLADIQDEAAALLAICAGTASAGTVRRHFEFDSGRIQITLSDVPLSTNASNGDYFGSVGAQTWGGACVLAEEIADNTAVFFPDPADVKDVSERTFRVLELGAGTGLVSLVAGKAAMLKIPGCKMDIIATDYYPSVLDNLKANIKANFPGPSPSLTISSQFLDWSSFSSPSDITSGADTSSPIGLFDVIFGADIIYEPLHASWIRKVVRNTLRKPSSSEKDCPDRNNNNNNGQGGVFHLVIPLRPTFVAESNTIEQEFRFAGPGLDKVKNDLVILSREIIVCDAEEEEEDDIDQYSVSDDVGNEAGEGNIVRYAYYIIGWAG
ncbi:hypothetical protein C8J55DRAFT_535885 [Lentinula edodes]|uniref:S-adenosyl-L-methionine-dependent methyltransferase n=1 Tax=Lentinula lateritia TaxID=40482 RepID=A0A9W9AG51_9AGAR|nr:hypothetical protein C8J55DRAFT_535885 [Lentinula edodes]